MVTATADAPRSKYGRKSTAKDVTVGMALGGRTALVTGCTSGIGYETMRALAMRGAHVLAVGRTQAKAAAAAARARAEGARGNITPLGCEHEDFASVVACAEVINALALPLDMVIANAGIVSMGKAETVNGIEKQFAVNHLSHFILVNRVLGLVKQARQGRIVMVSSDSHRSAAPEGIEFDNLDAHKGYKGLKAYSQSKLANHLFARELSHRLSGTKVTANSIHPGFVYTNIFHSAPKWLHWLIPIVRPFAKSPEAGAATMCYVATAPELANVTGIYFENCNPSVPTPNAENDALAARLWAVSEEMTKKYLG